MVHVPHDHFRRSYPNAKGVSVTFGSLASDCRGRGDWASGRKFAASVVKRNLVAFSNGNDAGGV